MKRSGIATTCYQWLTALAVVLPAFVWIAGCVEKTSTRSPSPTPPQTEGTGPKVDQSAIFIDRTENGMMALIRFRTDALAFCEIAWWAQDANNSPAETAAHRKMCSSPEPQTDFREQLVDLAPQTPYYFRIYTWAPEGSRDDATTILVREPSDNRTLPDDYFSGQPPSSGTEGDQRPSPSDSGGSGGSPPAPVPGGSGGASQGSPTSGDPTPPTDPGGGGGETPPATPNQTNTIIVARINAQQGVVELHEHTLDRAQTAANLRERFAIHEGCYNADPSPVAKLAQASGRLAVRSLSLRGFASGVSSRHPHFGDRLMVAFGAPRWGHYMEWYYWEDGENRGFRSRGAGRIVTLEASLAGDRLTPENAQLTRPPPSLAIRPGNDLELRWSSQSLAQWSRIVVQMGWPPHDPARICTFDARKGRGVVTQDELAKLPKGMNEVTVSLETLQLHIPDGSFAQRPWLIASRDWRSLRLEHTQP